MVRSTSLSPIGALGFYHRRVFLLVLTRAFADFSLLSLLSPKMRSQSLLEIPLNPTRKRSWCSSVFGFGVDVGVDVGVGLHGSFNPRYRIPPSRAAASTVLALAENLPKITDASAVGHDDVE